MPAPANAVTDLYDLAQGRNWVERNWERFVEIHAIDVTVEARTSAGERYRVAGREHAVAEARSLSDVGLLHLSMEVLAVNGDRLALIRWVNWCDETADGGGPAAVEQVCVVEANDEGKVQSVLIFEPEDIDAARAELGRRATKQ